MSVDPSTLYYRVTAELGNLHHIQKQYMTPSGLCAILYWELELWLSTTSRVSNLILKI